MPIRERATGSPCAPDIDWGPMTAVSRIAASARGFTSISVDETVANYNGWTASAGQPFCALNPQIR